MTKVDIALSYAYSPIVGGGTLDEEVFVLWKTDDAQREVRHLGDAKRLEDNCPVS